MHTGHVHRCAHEEERPALLLLTLLCESLDFLIRGPPERVNCTRIATYFKIKHLANQDAPRSK